MRPFVRDVATTLAARTGAGAFDFLGAIVVARTLGPAGQGTYAALVVLVQVAVSLVGLGIGKAAIYELGRGLVPPEVIKGTILRLGLWHGTLAATVVLVGASGFLRGANPTAVACVLPLTITWLLVGYAQSLLRGEGRIRACNASEMATAASGLVAAWAVSAWAPPTPAGFLLARTSGVIVGLWVALRALRPQVRWLTTTALGLAQRLRRYGVVFVLYSTSLLLIYRCDIMLLNFFIGERAAGWYSVAATLSETILYVPEAIVFVLLPHVARTERAAGAQATARACCWALGILAVLALAIALGAPWLLRLCFGDRFLAAIPALRVLVMGSVPLGAFHVLSGYFAGRGLQGCLALLAAVGLALNVGLNWWWIPAYGSVGAAWASFVAYGWLGAMGLSVFVWHARRSWSVVV